MNTLSAQTQFKLYQIHKMEDAILNTNPFTRDVDLSKDVAKKIKLMQSLEVMEGNPVIRRNNLKLRDFISQQVEEMQAIIKESVAKIGPEKEFYSDAIKATTESLIRNGIVLKNNMVHIIVNAKDSRELVQEGIDFDKFMLEKINSVISEKAESEPLFNKFFQTDILGHNGSEFMYNLKFPGYSDGQEMAFQVIKGLVRELGDKFRTLNSSGTNLNPIVSENVNYLSALRSNGLSLSQGLYATASSNLADNFRDVVNNDQRFEKVYDKWVVTAHENKEDFNFGMVK